MLTEVQEGIHLFFSILEDLISFSWFTLQYQWYILICVSEPWSSYSLVTPSLILLDKSISFLES